MHRDHRYCRLHLSLIPGLALAALALHVLRRCRFAADQPAGGPDRCRTRFSYLTTDSMGSPTRRRWSSSWAMPAWAPAAMHVRGLVNRYRQAGSKVFSTYIGCRLDQDPPYDPYLKTAVQELKGTDVILWLTVMGGKREQEDDKAVAIVREIADLAAAANLRVALYPHTGFYVATTADALRVVKKVDRKNVGGTINLCHELMTDQGDQLDATIQAALPHLFLVSINGADRKEKGYSWDRLIQPLGRGNFDVCGFLKKLQAAGYTGPIGLQCYAVKGDAVENLKQSISAWKEYSARLAAGAAVSGLPRLHRVSRGQDAHAQDQDRDPGHDPADALGAGPFPLARAEAVQVAHDDGERHERGVAHRDAQVAEPGKAQVEQIDRAVVQAGHGHGDQQQPPAAGRREVLPGLVLRQLKRAVQAGRDGAAPQNHGRRGAGDPPRLVVELFLGHRRPAGRCSWPPRRSRRTATRTGRRRPGRPACRRNGRPVAPGPDAASLFRLRSLSIPARPETTTPATHTATPARITPPWAVRIRSG